MATTYYRPNLTADEQARLLELLNRELDGLSYQDPEFEPQFALLLKLKKCRQISC
jgi:hypothetical protein